MKKVMNTGDPAFDNAVEALGRGILLGDVIRMLDEKKPHEEIIRYIYENMGPAYDGDSTYDKYMKNL